MNEKKNFVNRMDGGVIHIEFFFTRTVNTVPLACSIIKHILKFLFRCKSGFEVYAKKTHTQKVCLLPSSLLALKLCSRFAPSCRTVCFFLLTNVHAQPQYTQYTDAFTTTTTTPKRKLQNMHTMLQCSQFISCVCKLMYICICSTGKAQVHIRPAQENGFARANECSSQCKRNVVCATTAAKRQQLLVERENTIQCVVCTVQALRARQNNKTLKKMNI